MSKSDVVFGLIRDLLPPESDGSVEHIRLDMHALAQKAGMHQSELDRFISENRGLFRRDATSRTQRTERFLYAFADGYECVTDVIEAIAASRRNFRNFTVHRSK